MKPYDVILALDQRGVRHHLRLHLTTKRDRRDANDQEKEKR